MKFTLTKKTMKAGASPAKKMKAGDPVPTNFNLVDNGDQSFTVMGVDAAGNQVDISAVATITVSSDATSILTADVPSSPPATFAVHAVGPIGSANVTVTATWTDGSVGPFSAALAFTTTTGPAGKIVAVPGAVTTH